MRIERAFWSIQFEREKEREKANEFWIHMKRSRWGILGKGFSSDRRRLFYIKRWRMAHLAYFAYCKRISHMC
jgi:hypothetical protein